MGAGPKPMLARNNTADQSNSNQAECQQCLQVLDQLLSLYQSIEANEKQKTETLAKLALLQNKLTAFEIS